MIYLNKKTFYIIFIIIFTFILLNCLSCASFAWGEPQIVNKINSAFENIQKWILQISTPAAAVAVGSGVFMKKFSFGDEERLRTGKKIISGSLFSYAFLISIDLILSTINLLLT